MEIAVFARNEFKKEAQKHEDCPHLVFVRIDFFKSACEAFHPLRQNKIVVLLLLDRKQMDEKYLFRKIQNISDDKIFSGGYSYASGPLLFQNHYPIWNQSTHPF